MLDDDSRQRVIESYAIRIREIAIHAGAGVDVGSQMIAIVDGACAHIGALNFNSREAAVRELIEHVTVWRDQIHGSQRREREAFTLAIQAAKDYIDGLAD